MAKNIILHLREYLGAHIQKIDPNTQAIDDKDHRHKYDLLAQASVPAVLVAFYKFTRTPEGAAGIASYNKNISPLDFVLGDLQQTAMQRVAQYAGVGTGQAKNVMDAVADETLRFLRNELGSTLKPDTVQQYFSSQRHDILSHLPEDLQMGYLLQDSTIDDRANKMEGPMSGLAHTIESIFSASGADKNKDKPKA
ncbi:DUF937 domain-containing protein [Flavihumibacter solisilvae]|uniref:Uncharacterized protein n=1 Tax=Flavihumibacter solisilvae TaxID=1349421 RepID=A0A0C1J0M1_9BACT|nr:DUF937 domain-containing protein [Flavihumibacter solisilvae]KIC96319.1 hypothetical protein OI18_00730 [Flavihumibacter solisilvae]